MSIKRADGEGTFSRRGQRHRFQMTVNGRRVSGSGRTKSEAKAAALEKAKMVGDRRVMATFSIRLVRERLAAGDLWADSGHVLTTHHGQVLEPRNYSRVWSGWAAAAKLPNKGTHTGRRYAATRLLASGRASVADVAAALGHDPSVLLNTYAIAVADGQLSAADALGATLNPRSDAAVDGATNGATASGNAETG